MAKPYDAVTKYLMATRPQDWIALIGLPMGTATLLDTDLSTVTSGADGAFKITPPLPCKPYVFHVEGQGSGELPMPIRVLRYNVLLYYETSLPVISVVVLLRPSADTRTLTGTLIVEDPFGAVIHTFHYRVLRLWQLPAETFLKGGLGVLPLAPLSNIKREQVPQVVRQMQTRIETEATSVEAAELWTATYVLMGLRYKREFAAQVLKGVRQMRESTTFQAIIEEGLVRGRLEGRVEGQILHAQETLLRLGLKRLGKPSATVIAAVQAIRDVNRLDTLTERLLEVESWRDLFLE